MNATQLLPLSVVSAIALVPAKRPPFTGLQPGGTPGPAVAAAGCSVLVVVCPSAFVNDVWTTSR